MALNNKYIAERYEIKELIGQGGMADVYLAYDMILGRNVAIKILRNYLAEDSVYLQRFQREASAAATITHRNIVQVYDVGEDRGYHYIVMEYVPDATLKDLIHKRGAVHVEESIDIMRQLVSGVEVAHRHGIIHRDLKPQNILMTHGGHVKIADFGIAMVESFAQVTQTETIMGSLHYLAPELARGEKATNQSDIYALGIIFYELLNGDVPFNADNAVNIALKHMREELPSIRESNPTIPQSVENIIIKATAKNCKERYQDTKDFLNDLELALQNPNVGKLVLTSPNLTEANTTLITEKLGGEQPNRRMNREEPLRKQEEAKKKKKQKTIIASSVVGIISIILIVAVYFLVNGLNNKETLIEVPNLVNLTLEQAKGALEEVGLELDETYTSSETSDTIDAGRIISYASAGEKVSKGTKIKVVISKGKEIIIDNYVGMKLADAIAKLNALDQDIYIVEKYEESEEYDEGIVISQSLVDGTTIKPDASNKQIILTVSLGYKLTVKSVIGWTVDSAKKELTDAGFIVSLESLTPPTNATEIANMKLNIVMDQSLDSGTKVTKNEAKITLYYYNYKPSVNTQPDEDEPSTDTNPGNGSNG